MTIIAIASGKGGTGKTTVAVNLIALLNEKQISSCLLDCDVEEPNCHLFLKYKDKESIECNSYIPTIDKEHCNICGKCVNVCEYQALAKVKSSILLFTELCHGCGSCELVCQNKAIQEGHKHIGFINSYKGLNSLVFLEGQLKIREPLSPLLIRQVKQCSIINKSKNKITIIDCPPGTACSMVAAVEETDFVLMVTEPTLFGINDLILAVEVVKKLNLRCGIVINKSSEHDVIIEKFTKLHDIPILGKIPNSEEIARCCSKGDLIIEKIEETKCIFEDILKGLMQLDGIEV